MDQNLRALFSTSRKRKSSEPLETFLSPAKKRNLSGDSQFEFDCDKDDDSSVYQVLEIESMEKMQEGLSNPAIAKMRTDAGVDLDSQKITFLVE